MFHCIWHIYIDFFPWCFKVGEESWYKLQCFLISTVWAGPVDFLAIWTVTYLLCELREIQTNMWRDIICSQEIIYTKDEQIIGVFFSFISNTLHICHKKPEHDGWAQRKTSYNPQMKSKSYHWVSPLSIIFVSKKGKIVPSE